VTPDAVLAEDLRRAVAAWTAQDPDPATRAETERLLQAAEGGDEAASAELADAFSGRLAFGTAGLRGRLGPGPNRMNRVVVGQAAAGLATYLLDTGAAGGAVLIGHDARHGSAEFARDTAEILAGAGFPALLAPGPVPTPAVAFGIRHLGCVAGVVVTASHNPPQDNGYKVYLGDGSQIVPPADAEIAARIDDVARRDLADVRRSDDYTVLGPELLAAYRDRLVSLVPADAPRELTWAYTPLHGVGGSLVAEVAAAAGFAPPHVVASQAEPDPDFPTVAFPNPEEPGAIDAAIALAEQTGADVVVANDPDADRCAVASPFPTADAGSRWRMLTGDELGALLGEDALRRGVQGTYACSVVSSSLLQVLATAYGQPFTATLTGFKWIGRVPGLAFGYEEAIGYCVDPEAVRDKDGVSALVRVLVLVAGLRAAGLTVADRLDEIARTYGVFATDQLAVRVDDLSVISDAMARLRAEPPTTLVGEDVHVTDLAEGSEALPPTDGVRLQTATSTVVVRPSGTEPKLKAYLEARVPLGQVAGLAADRDRARRQLDTLRREVSAALGL
jgi:phosphomannomutase